MNTHNTDTAAIGQENCPDFGMELSLAIRGLYSAANAAPGPAFRKILTRAAADIEDAQSTFGIRRKVADAAARLDALAKGDAQ